MLKNTLIHTALSYLESHHKPLILLFARYIKGNYSKQNKHVKYPGKYLLSSSALIPLSK